MTATRTNATLKFAVLALLVTAIAAFFLFGGQKYLTLDSLKGARGSLAAFVAARPVAAALMFVGAYIVIVALSLPGAAVMTLGAGAIFGLVEGVVLASIASTIGATLAMMAARLIARDWVMRKYPAAVAKVDDGVRKDGALYLLSLRLAPIFPFFVVNLVMGLTAMPVLRYAALTMLGAFPGTVVFAFAGTALAQVRSLGDVVSAPLLGAFLGLAILPLIGKGLSGWLRDRKALRRWQRPRKYDANLIVIGAGSAGLVASYAAAAMKSRVILVEAAEMGGDCLNTGCVPSKALIRAGKAAAEVRKAGRFGIDAELRGVRFADVVAHIRGAITAIAPHDSVERFTGLGVDVRQARATIVDPWTVALDNGDRLTTRAILLATGAHPVVPPIPGLADSGFVTSETLWDRLATFDRPPERVVLLGGGAIGCEIAQALARLGSQVALVEQADRLLAKEEPEAAAAVNAALTADGVRLVLGRAAERVGEGAVHIAGGEALPFDLLIVAVGRKSRFEGLGLEAFGLDEKALVADRRGRGPFGHWFVAGDAGGGPQFTHFAGHSGAIAGINALVGAWLKTETLVPRVTYTSPEVASIGIAQCDAPADAEIVSADIADNDRDITEAGPGGLVKLIIRKGRLLGVTIVSEQAGEMIVAWQLAMKRKVKLSTMLALLYPYPTRADAGREAANHWRQSHQPQRILAIAERWFRWRRG